MAFKYTGKINPERCQAAVAGSDRAEWFHPHQCQRKVWRDGWCRQHHPETEQVRESERTAKYEAKWDRERQRQHLANSAGPLLAALQNLLERYIALINCGDCGHWDPEQEAVVIAARAAIAQATGTEAANG